MPFAELDLSNQPPGSINLPQDYRRAVREASRRPAGDGVAASSDLDGCRLRIEIGSEHRIAPVSRIDGRCARSRCMAFKPKPDRDRLRASATRYINFQRLQSDPHGVLLIRLMHAANDIYLAKWTGWKFEPRNKGRIPRFERHMRIGANQYFIRLMSGHLNEGVSLVHEFNRHPTLLSFVNRLPSICQDAHEEVCACLKGGKDFNHFQRTVGALRNKAVFHYDPKLIRITLDNLANRREPVPAKITMRAIST